MVNYLGAVWRCRYFWMMLVKMDLRTRYRRSVLGLGWSLLHPILLTIVICTMFSTVMGIDWRVYGTYLLAGLAYWSYVVTATSMGCQSLFMGESYIRQHPAPLAIYPLRTTLGAMIHFVLALCVVIPTAGLMGRAEGDLVAAGVAQSVVPTGDVIAASGLDTLYSLLTLVPTLLLLFLLGWSLAVLTGFANVYFQDTQHLTEVGFQILFYATPILYPVSMLEKNGLEWLAQCNPLAAFLELVRQPVLLGQVPSLTTFGVAAATVLVTGVAACFTLARLQRRLIFQL